MRQVKTFRWVARILRVADIDDQVEACRRIFASERRWTVVRGSDLEEGESEGLPVWSRHVQDPILQSNKTRRIDFALFMVEALTNDQLIHEAPAIVGRRTPSALERDVLDLRDAHPAWGGRKLRRRLLDLGFVPGTEVVAETKSPGGDPVAYRIRGTLIAVRREQASLIRISHLSPATP